MVIGCNTRRQGAWRPVNRGDAQGGVQRSFLNPLLWGEPPAFGGVGGTLPPRLSPGGGNGKGGDSNSLLPQAITGGVNGGGQLQANPRKPLQPLESRNSHLFHTLPVECRRGKWRP